MATLSTFVLPNILCAVIFWCFSAICCCGWNGPTLSMSQKKPNPTLDENLNLVWSLLIVHQFWWNLDMLLISILSNSLPKVFDIHWSLLNCCVVKKLHYATQNPAVPSSAGNIYEILRFLINRYRRYFYHFDQTLQRFFSHSVDSVTLINTHTVCTANPFCATHS